MADAVGGERRFRMRARCPFGGIDQGVHRAGFRIDADDIACVQFRQRTGIRRFRRDVDRGKYLARGAGHAAIGEQGDTLAAILQGRQRGRQFVQFRHAVGARALAAHARDELGIAVLLNQGMRGLPFYRSVFYLPSLMGSSVAIAILWRQIFGTSGLVNQVLMGLGFTDLPGWISDPDTALGTIILLHIWTFGSPMIIFLAGLRQIPTMYYEAAAVDGASKWTQFWRITMPLLSPIIFFNLVLQIIGAFQSFTQAFIVSGGTGGPSDSTMFYTLYLYQKGFANFDMGYASAMAWLLLIIIGVFTALNFFVSKYWVFYDD